jgi:Rad52/22 family double-strand break repair protein
MSGTRRANGASLHYVEGWHVIAEANRIFGYDAWDRRTIATPCVWTGASGQYHAAAYTARVRVSVRAGDIIIVREGSGTGEGRALTPGQAHDLALKGAETDATKRRLPPSAIPSVLPFMTVNRLGFVSREMARLRQRRTQQQDRGCCARPLAFLV